MSFSLSTAAVICTLSCSLVAQLDSPPKSPEAVGEAHVRFSPLLKSNELLGQSVKGNGGEEVGVIREVVVDSREGRTAFFMIELTTSDDRAKKLFAVPFAAVKQDAARRNLILNIDPKRIESGAGFAPDRWPDMSDPKWALDLHERYGYEPYWLQDNSPHSGGRAVKTGTLDRPAPAQPSQPGVPVEQPEPARDNPLKDQPAATEAASAGPQLNRDHPWMNRLSQMLAKPVHAAGDKPIGTLSDVVIDMDGRVVYGVISHGPESQPRLAAVPWSALESQAREQRYVIEMTPDLLQSISFDDKTWPNMHEVFWARQLHERFAQEPYWRVYGVARDEDAYWGDDSSYNRSFASKPAQAFGGKIVKIEDFIPGRGAARGKLLVVMSDDNREYIVHLGPEDYLNQQSEFKFKIGDTLSVDGVTGVFHGREVVQARKVKTRDGRVLELRDDKGKVKWRRSAIRGDQNDKNDRGEHDRGETDTRRDKNNRPSDDKNDRPAPDPKEVPDGLNHRD